MKIGNNNTIKNSVINSNNLSIAQIGNDLFINGKKIEQPKSMFFKNTFCQVNNKNYINGKELKNGKWKYTLKSLFYCIF